MTTNTRNPEPRSTPEEVIEMLETLLDGIVTTTAKRYCMTIIEGVRHDSTEFVLKEAIKHIRKEIKS